MLKNFTLPRQAPQLVGGIGQGGPVDEFVAKFGNKWRKTHIEGVYFIGVDGCQFTLRCNEVAYYDFATLAEFKDLFQNNPSAAAGNAEYFFLKKENKYHALDIIDYLKTKAL